MKNILTGNEAIEMYEKLQSSHSLSGTPRACGYFTSDNYVGTEYYDSGTIVAFDSTKRHIYEEAFSTEQEAIDWINL